MLNRFPSALARTSSPHLPQRRWMIRPPYGYLRALIGALIGGAGPFYLWWLRMYDPLWPILIPLLLGAFLLYPAPLMLGLDERGAALIIPGWRDRYLWIPRNRLASIRIQNGWLIAAGTQVEQQGELSWKEAAHQAGAIVPPWLTMLAGSSAAPAQIAAPIYLLDQVARDEIELWLYRQGK